MKKNKTILIISILLSACQSSPSKMRSREPILEQTQDYYSSIERCEKNYGAQKCKSARGPLGMKVFIAKNQVYNDPGNLTYGSLLDIQFFDLIPLVF